MSDNTNQDSNYKLYNLILLSSKRALYLQNKEGAFSPGHNGVKNDPETPVRNTSHWLITMLKAYTISNEIIFREAAYNATKYLLSKDARPMEASFWHRKNPEKDFCNGLMGQAYTIEALSLAYNEFKDEKIKKVAEEVFLLHPFNKNTGLWRRVAVDGSHLSTDGTFNHQLWFASSGALLYKFCGNEEIGKRVNIFLDNLHINLKIYRISYVGMIKHPLFRIASGKNRVPKQIINIIVELMQYRKNQIEHALSYHMFNLYAFCLLKRCYPNHEIWNSNKLKRTMSFMKSKKYIENVENRNFMIPTIPGGFETSFIERIYVLDTFFNDTDNIQEKKRLIRLQFKNTYNFETNMMNKNATDPHTQAARIYKATRLSDISFSL